MHHARTATDSPRRLHKHRQDASDRPQNDVKPVSMDSAQEENDDSWQLSDSDQDDVDGLTPRRSVQGTLRLETLHHPTSTTSGTPTAALTQTTSVEEEAPVDSYSHVSGKASTPTSEGSRNEDMDFCSAFFQYATANRAIEKEKLALKREQLEYSKKAQEYKHVFDMQKLALETRRMELEHQRMLEKQKLDAEYRLVKLKSSDKFALAELDFYPEYRNRQSRNRQRGRGRQPESISWF